MTMATLPSIACFILYFTVLIHAQYRDDMDYNDVDLYDDLPVDYRQNFAKERKNTGQDDFYILTGFEDAEAQNDHYLDTNDITAGLVNDDKSFKARKSFDWYKLPERVYRYTKHRIPGYDYDELDYVGVRTSQQCDDKSVWTHCLCQFTCSEPDIVDCYTPCKSGCECKEDYVFDENTQQCLLPENCFLKTDNYIYNM